MPRNVGELPCPAVVVEVSNPVCGDIMRLSATHDGQRILQTAYRTRGCTASIAAGSVLTVMITGKSFGEVVELKAQAVAEALGGLTAESQHAAVLCVDAVKALVKRCQVMK